MKVRICLVGYQAFRAALQVKRAGGSLSYKDKQDVLQCLSTRTETGGWKYKTVNNRYKPVEDGEDPLDLACIANNKTVLPDEFLWTVLALLFPIFLYENQHLSAAPKEIKGEFLKSIGLAYYFCREWTSVHLFSTEGETVVPDSVPSIQQQQELLRNLLKANLEPAALNGDARKIGKLLHSASLPAPPSSSSTRNAANSSRHSIEPAVPAAHEQQRVPVTLRHAMMENSLHQLALGGAHNGAPSHAGQFSQFGLSDSNNGMHFYPGHPAYHNPSSFSRGLIDPHNTMPFLGRHIPALHEAPLACCLHQSCRLCLQQFDLFVLQPRLHDLRLITVKTNK